jgi:hypothetical protein
MYSGAKGVAEVNVCPPMAAIANAIGRAVGKWLNELPMSPLQDFLLSGVEQPRNPHSEYLSKRPGSEVDAGG